MGRRKGEAGDGVAVALVQWVSDLGGALFLFPPRLVLFWPKRDAAPPPELVACLRMECWGVARHLAREAERNVEPENDLLGARSPFDPLPDWGGMLDDFQPRGCSRATPELESVFAKEGAEGDGAPTTETAPHQEAAEEVTARCSNSSRQGISHAQQRF